MRSIILSLALFVVVPSVNCKKSSCIYKADGDDKKIVSQLSEYEIFAQKYELTFEEKPSDQVWNSRNKSCGARCCSNCN